MRHRLPLFLLCMGLGGALLLFGHRLPALRGIDHHLAQSVAESQQTDAHLMEMEGETIVVRKLIAQQKPPSVRVLRVTDDEDQIFENSPPSPLDYAVILEHILKSKGSSVSLTNQMTWEAESPIEATTLNIQLEKFSRSIIGLSLTRGATAQTPPPAVQRGLIPYSQCRGSYRLLPVVNQTTLPTRIDGGSNNLAGFDTLEHIPQAENQLVLLANWHEQGLAPSMELLMLIQLYGVPTDQLIIDIGKHIRLGTNGPVIPLDTFGRTPLPAHNTQLPKGQPASSFISKENKPQPAHWWVAADPAAQRVMKTQLLSEHRLEALYAMRELLPVPGTAEKTPRLPLWAEFVILLDVALLVCWFSTATTGNRLLIMLLIGLLLYSLQGALLDISHHWVVLTAPWSAVLLGILFPVKPRPKSSSLKEYDASEPKPILRV